MISSWQERNRSRRNEYQREWYNKHRLRLNKYQREWRYAHGANPNYYYSNEEKQKIIKLYKSGYSLRKLSDMFGRDRGRMGKMLQRECVILRTQKESVALLKKDKPKICGWKKQQWAQKVISRDKKCMECGSTENLEAHHMIAKLVSPELALKVSNGLTLCHTCHLKTDSYGNGKSS